MLTEQQREALAHIENQLGAQDPGLAHALDTMAPPVVVSRSRRTARWLFLAAALCTPVLTITALVLMPISYSLILALGVVVLTASIRTARAIRWWHRRRHSHAACS